jgi:hypothetical protein
MVENIDAAGEKKEQPMLVVGDRSVEIALPRKAAPRLL